MVVGIAIGRLMPLCYVEGEGPNSIGHPSGEFALKRVAIQRAEERLQSARDALERMKQAKMMSTLNREWTQFLLAANGVFEMLEIGADGCNQSKPWFGRQKGLRKSDELLKYLHAARNCEEHGLDRSIQHAYWVEVVDGVRLSVEAEFLPNGDIQAFVDGDRNKPYFLPLTGALVAVTDQRYRQTFQPPGEHMGSPIPKVSAFTVAELAIKFLDHLLNQASELPAHA